MDARDRVRRPTTIVVALALTAFSGVANILVGAAVLTLLHTGRLPSAALSDTTLMTLGWGYLFMGALTLSGAVGLLVRTRGGRTFVTVVMALRIVVACVSFGVVGGWYSAGSVVGILLSVVVIALLWDSRANEYFHVTG